MFAQPIPWLWPLLTHRQPDGRGQCKIQDSCSQAVACPVARAEVVRKQEDKYTIWVKIRNNRKEVFRANS